jgi:glycosyltransferase involved in cell wall biosynthesis
LGLRLRPNAKITLRVLRAEGWRGFRDRALDRLAEARRRRAFSTASVSSLPDLPAELRTPVLHLAATPPAPRLGGVQAQLLVRIDDQARREAVSLLYPDANHWRLEVASPSARRAWGLAPAPPPSSVALFNAEFEEAVARAAAALGAGLVRVEGLAGLPLGSLLALRRRGLGLIVSVHDFAAFCPRPHLLEEPALRFCHYSRDPQRCAACLRVDWPVESGWQEERRAVAGELLAGAETVVYPSDFLRRTYLELFPGLDPARQRVVAPEVAALAGLHDGAGRHPARERSRPLHAAFVGSVKPHKGALVFEEVVGRMATTAPGAVRWSVYGGGDAELLRRLRRLPGVRVRGYYRSGALPRLLVREKVDVALLLSVVPESFGLTLSECRAAGVPAVAFDLGAVADRIRDEGGGVLVPLAAGAGGVVQALVALLAGSRD